jgi:flagellar secretion chaperone FliS
MMRDSLQRHSHNALSARTYAQIGLETEVLGASPERLITLLFRAARTAVAKARLHLQSGNIAGRGMAISQAINIVDCGLKASVDHEAGGDLAKSLTTVYDVIIHHLLLANLDADMHKLELAERLLADIGDAWATAADSTPANSTP